MKRTPDLDRVASAQLQRPQGVVLKGQFIDVLRSPKGKIKGVCLQTETATYSIKLPKYLRPVLVRELTPGDFVQVWAYCEAEQWRGINILPLSEPERIDLQENWQARQFVPTSSPNVDTAAVSEASAIAPTEPSASAPKPLCVQVCRKGKCFKQGGRQIMQSLETAIADDPNLQHVSVEGVGCLKACKKGPNIKLSHSKKVISGVTPDNALTIVTKYA
ncbi:(2Fe-2S) ferredoxin domain-containing protein [Leptolyngbya iicbica]|uniref:(2Fe-2S) ferredoxin domain-containing protein n=2 Tax=Cyanophyceae TaxID=3028117 RepID=A0A4Q7E6Q5_9CYAN|nr:(2Fe-2S) ferredoxin domain-containing protein [Leptolyngbya sp. LK]RZM78820.1 (2Fe-2S) ferredoxin domain-containing protein [Leptolyngbya sp. LK]